MNLLNLYALETVQIVRLWKTKILSSDQAMNAIVNAMEAYVKYFEENDYV